MIRICLVQTLFDLLAVCDWLKINYYDWLRVRCLVTKISWWLRFNRLFVQQARIQSTE